MNSIGGDKEAEIDVGKGKKRKLVNVEETSSKQRLRSDHMETVAKENGEPPIFKLPGELLVKIIDMVPITQWASLESVNHKFQDVVYGLWGSLREIRLDEFVYKKEKKPRLVVDAVLEKFLLRSPNVTSISGFDEVCDQFGYIRLSTLSKFQHLETIDFSGQDITGSNFAALLESSASRQSWKRLDISGISGPMTSHNRVGSKNQPALTLEYLKFSSHTIDISDGFLPIDWSRLKELVIVNRSCSTKEVLSIIRQCTQLAHLEIKVPHCGNRNGQPPYAEFMQTVADLENLSILKIDGSSPWTWSNAFYDRLLVLIQHLGRRTITDLALMKFDCSDQIMGAIIDYLPRLKSLELNVGYCTKQSLERLANRMGQLESLKLMKCGCEVDGTVIRAIVSNMKNLQCLHLENPYFEDSEDFTSLADLRNLKELCIKGEDIDSGTLETLAHLGFGACLEKLELRLEDGISREVMGDFLKNMPRLRKIKLDNATGDILQAIVGFCPNLVELDLRKFMGGAFGYMGIQLVIDHCSQLKFLNVTKSCFRKEEEWFPAALKVGKYRKIIFTSKWN